MGRLTPFVHSPLFKGLKKDAAADAAQQRVVRQEAVGSARRERGGIHSPELKLVLRKFGRGAPADHGGGAAQP